MIYEEFCLEFEKELLNKTEEFKIKPEFIKSYKEGYIPDKDDLSDLMFVRETNIKYHKQESDVLIGDYLVITDDDENPQVARFEMKYMYDSFCESGWNMVWEIVKDNLSLCQTIRECDLLNCINRYEVVKDKLIIRPLNYDIHKLELKNAIYRKVGDIVLVLYLLVYDTRNGDLHNVGSVKVQRALLGEWNVAEEELWNTAMINSYMIAPPRMFLNPLDSYKPAYSDGAFMALGDKTTISPTQVPLVTTTMQLNGAIAMFYPGVKERIADMIGGDYLVVFTSSLEARIHKYGSVRPIVALRNLKAMNEELPEDKILTRRIYLFESSTGKFNQMNL